MLCDLRSSSNSQQTDKKKKISYLQTALREQTEKRQQAESRLQDYRHRSLAIKNEFTRMIEKYDQNLASLNGQQTYTQQIWTKMMSTVEQFNRTEERLLSERCKQVEQTMNRRLNQVYKKMDKELLKSKQLSFEQLLQIKSDIKQAITLAQFIYEENVKFKITTKELVFKIKVLNQEKNLLIEELNDKKMIVLKLVKKTKENKLTLRSESRNSQYSSLKQYSVEPIRKNTSRMITAEMKTIDHLKSCCERQKKKKMQLGSIVNQLQGRMNQIANLINKVDDIKLEPNPQTKCFKLESVLDIIKLKMYITDDKRKQSRSTLTNFDLYSYT